ncbi:MAG: hypothetical protein GEU79_02715 [Acidimicrobiia bacterium]|nr:hypothetical protein [Acidimicrobiia bacterium]
MLSKGEEFLHIIEVNPPAYPDMSHKHLEDKWGHVIITDNVFGTIRVSPFAFGARLAHDVPGMETTVVVSTRDRNILAIESEVRGALWNGVDSYLVVVGDSFPTVEHNSNHFEIVEHLLELQETIPAFEVGMPARFRRWHLQRRIDLGAQFFEVGPVVDPDTIEEQVKRMELEPDDPPVFLSVIPPFSQSFVDRVVDMGGVSVTDRLRSDLDSLDKEDRREYAWKRAGECSEVAEGLGLAGVVVMGLRYETAVGEDAAAWHMERHGQN